MKLSERLDAYSYTHNLDLDEFIMEAQRLEAIKVHLQRITDLEQELDEIDAVSQKIREAARKQAQEAEMAQAVERE